MLFKRFDWHALCDKFPGFVLHSRVIETLAGKNNNNLENGVYSFTPAKYQRVFAVHVKETSITFLSKRVKTFERKNLFCTKKKLSKVGICRRPTVCSIALSTD